MFKKFMKDRTACGLDCSAQGRGGAGQRQRTITSYDGSRRAVPVALAVVAALGVASCGDPARDLAVGTVGYVQGFAGAVAADEPRAALVARDVLAAGGTAADAAVALGLTLTVTLPSSASIAGGGMCMVHDSATKTTELLDFMPPTAQASVRGMAPTQGAPVAIPTLSRGLYALSAKYGRLRWEALIAPAESIARFGEPVSRAFLQELAEAKGHVGADPVARAVFSGPTGRPIQEGELLVQLDLAGTLGRLRQHGPGVLYGGQLGREYVQAIQGMGGLLSIEALRAYGPVWAAVDSQPEGYETYYTPVSGTRGRVLPDATASASNQGPNGGATGFVVADLSGSSVACVLTTTIPFGYGKMMPGMGVMPVPPGPEPGQPALPVALGMMINTNVNELHFAMAGGGMGIEAEAARLADAVIRDERPLAEAIVDIGTGPNAAPGNLTVLSCPEGIPPNPGSCFAGVDPRGTGYGIIVNPPR